MTNQIETQLANLKLNGMSKTWTALKETRKSQSLSLSEGLELLLQAEEQNGTTEDSEDLNPMRDSATKPPWKNLNWISPEDWMT